nr:hypothetical protein [Tanacetum cinerariifolium]
MLERNQDPLALVANHQMTPPHFNTFQSSYNNPQLQQLFPPSQYGSIHLTQHYSYTYPSQTQFNHSSVLTSYPYQSQMNHQTSYVPQIAYHSPQVITQPMTESPLVDSGLAVLVFFPGDDPIACLNKAMAFLIACGLRSCCFGIPMPLFKMARSQYNKFRGDTGKVIIVLVIRVMLLVLGEQCKWICKAVLVTNISNYGSDVISKEPHSETYLNDMENQSVHAMLDFEQTPVMDVTEKLALKEQVDSLKQNLYNQIKEKECLLQTFTIFKSESKEKEDKYMENEIDLEKKIKELHNIIFKDFGKRFVPQQELSADEAFGYHMLNPSTKSFDALPVKIESPKELPKLQDKDTTTCKLKEIIKINERKVQEIEVDYDYCEIEIKNVELENSVAKLILENECLCKEINHVKHVFKDQFDSIKKTRGCTKEQSDSLIDKMKLKSTENEDLKSQIQDKVFVITSLKNDLQKVKGKEIVDIAAQKPYANTIVPGMFKLDLDPLAHKLLQNREAHIDYLMYTQEQADILQGIVKKAKAKKPLDNAAKKVAATPKNNVKQVRFAEPLTSSRNIKQVASSKTSDSNTSVLSPTGLKCITSKCKSKPTGNKKNDMISKTPSRNIKNKIEAHPRKVNKKNHVVEPIRDVDVKQSQLNANSKLICATCCLDCSLISGFQMFKTYDREPLSAHKFVSKFLGTIRFRNDHIARIM